MSNTAGGLPDAEAFNSTPRATVFNHSWNLGTETGYEETARILDRATRRLNTVSYTFPGSSTITGASGYATPSLHVVSAGNISGADVLVLAPATAKNVITVGATENYNQESYTPGCANNNSDNADEPRRIAGFSRFGPSNLRLKPDLVAPGTRAYGFRSIHQVVTCSEGTNCNADLLGSGSDPRYDWAAGTSFAAPAVAGAAAIVRNWYQTLGIGRVPSPALVKATLIAVSRNLAPCATGCGTCTTCAYCGDMHPAPDKYQGWGGVSLDRLFRASNTFSFFDQQQTFTTNGQAWTTLRTIEDRTKETTIALVWTDRASIDTVNTNQNLVNDLDLEISYVSGGVTHRYYGNNFYTSIDSCNRDGYSLLDPTPSYDRKNNVEKILIRPSELPAGVTQLTIKVTAFALTGDGIDPDGATNRQDFAIMTENARNALSPPSGL